MASDFTGGTALENIKCRVTASGDGPIKATNDICSGKGGWLNLWSGTPSRTIEGALLGAVFLVGSTATKKQVLAMGAGKNVAALAGGVVGGVVQAVVMTPAGMVFTSLNVNKGKPGYENDNAITVARRIIKDKGLQGMYVGGTPMALRQASNWASRGLFTELCRTNLKLSRFGLLGEIGSGGKKRLVCRVSISLNAFIFVADHRLSSSKKKLLAALDPVGILQLKPFAY